MNWIFTDFFPLIFNITIPFINVSLGVFTAGVLSLTAIVSLLKRLV